MTKSLRIVWLVLVIAFAAAVVVVPPARANMARPAWSVGDYWAYDVLGASPLLPGSGTLRGDVAGTETVRVDGVDYPSYRLATVARLQIVGPFTVYVNLSGNAWYRTSDLSLVKEATAGTEEVPGIGSFPIAETLTWSPPQDIRWPLTTGTIWATSGWMNITLTILGIPNYMNTTVVANWAVEPERTVTVPAGSFLTTPLNGTDPSGSWNTSYWSPDAGNFVLQSSFDSTGVGMQRIALTGFRYAAATDTAPPTITGVTATPAVQDAGGSVTIAATVTDDSQVATVFVNVTMPGGSTLNRSMTAGTGNRWSLAQTWGVVGVHNFVIWARDVTGKSASAVGSFTIRTPDAEKPRIVHTPPAGPFYTDTAIGISANVTDNTAVAEVKLVYTNVTGVEQNVTMTLASGSIYTYTIPAQGATGPVRYRIYAVDPSGNANLTQEYTLTVEALATGLSPVVLAGLVGIILLVVIGAVAALVIRRRRKQAAPPPPPPPSPP